MPTINTWSLEELPKGEKLIGCKWVFAVKRDHLGKVERFKSRLVAKGYAQRFGINYNETFSPVARYSSIRLVIALAVEYKMYMHQMDVASAYLNSELTDVTDARVEVTQVIVRSQTKRSYLEREVGRGASRIWLCSLR